MSITVVTAVSAPSEAAIATALGTDGELRVVRRCPDVTDLLAVAQAGRAQVAVISPDLAGVRRSVLADLRSSGVAVVGVFDPYDEAQERTLRQWAVARIVSVHDPGALVALVLQAAAGADSGRGSSSGDVDLELALLTGDAAEGDDDSGHDDGDAMAGARTGRIVAVWGAVGSTGRTTLAVNLAAELVLGGSSAMVVDADTYGACVGQLLALLDEAPGIAAAVRLAEAGRLDAPGLAAVAPTVDPGFRVLTGISRASRWPEIREEALTQVLQTARLLVDYVVVDCAAPIEEDEELSYDTLAPRRNAATLASLRAADTVVVVGTADPVGLQRLVRALEDLRPLVQLEPKVVVTRVRGSAVGGSPEIRVTEALERFAGVRDLSLVPEDRDAVDAALLAGRTLAAGAPHSPAREAIAALAAQLSGAAHPARRGRLRALRRGAGSR